MKNGSTKFVANDARSQRVRVPKQMTRKRRIRDHVFTLGIEEELQIIDPETRELRSRIQQILADGKILLKEGVKPELHQSMVELGTDICSDARDARQQVLNLRSELAKLAAQHGLKIASAGTHPFSHWMDQLITVHERYATIVKDMQQIARPRESNFWIARSRGHSQSRNGHPCYESGALFLAAHLRAFGQLTVLGGTKHWAERLSAEGIRAFPPHRHPRFIRVAFRVRRLLQAVVK